jgi:1-acylglycerone phosphate reductase
MAPKIALITGCSSGIGYALAGEFASRGIKVVATARKVESLRALQQNHPNITALQLDVCNSDSIDGVYKRIKDLAPDGLAFLVNNAGFHYAAPAVELDIDAVRRGFETNVLGVMRMCGKFSGLLIKGQGTIIQIGSAARVIPAVFQSAYNATKAAMSQYTKTLRLVSHESPRKANITINRRLQELEPFDVKVCEIVTSHVRTNALQNGLQCPPDSRYRVIKDHVEKTKLQRNQNGMLPAEFARRVCDKVIRKNPPSEFWEGGQNLLLYLLASWIPTWMSVSRACHFSRSPRFTGS